MFEIILTVGLCMLVVAGISFGAMRVTGQRIGVRQVATVSAMCLLTVLLLFVLCVCAAPVAI